MLQVTEATKLEYLHLLVEHRLVGSIRDQLDAVRRGIEVVVDKDTMRLLIKHTSVAELKLLICGAAEIDVG